MYSNLKYRILPYIFVLVFATGCFSRSRKPNNTPKPAAAEKVVTDKAGADGVAESVEEGTEGTSTIIIGETSSDGAKSAAEKPALAVASDAIAAAVSGVEGGANPAETPTPAAADEGAVKSAAQPAHATVSGVEGGAKPAKKPASAAAGSVAQPAAKPDKKATPATAGGGTVASERLSDSVSSHYQAQDDRLPFDVTVVAEEKVDGGANPAETPTPAAVSGDTAAAVDGSGANPAAAKPEEQSANKPAANPADKPAPATASDATVAEEVVVESTETPEAAATGSGAQPAETPTPATSDGGANSAAGKPAEQSAINPAAQPAEQSATADGSTAASSRPTTDSALSQEQQAANEEGQHQGALSKFQTMKESLKDTLDGNKDKALKTLFQDSELPKLFWKRMPELWKLVKPENTSSQVEKLKNASSQVEKLIRATHILFKQQKMEKNHLSEFVNTVLGRNLKNTLTPISKEEQQRITDAIVKVNKPEVLQGTPAQQEKMQACLKVLQEGISDISEALTSAPQSSQVSSTA